MILDFQLKVGLTKLVGLKKAGLVKGLTQVGLRQAEMNWVNWRLLQVSEQFM